MGLLNYYLPFLFLRNFEGHLLRDYWESRNRRELPENENPTTNICNGEGLNALPLRWGTR